MVPASFVSSAACKGCDKVNTVSVIFDRFSAYFLCKTSKSSSIFEQISIRQYSHVRFFKYWQNNAYKILTGFKLPIYITVGICIGTIVHQKMRIYSVPIDLTQKYPKPGTCEWILSFLFYLKSLLGLVVLIMTKTVLFFYDSQWNYQY